uniref:Uncharacterized protein n=1 Tax=Rhizophora mucronata TaxID=61149 RepID=A0A2P2N0S1_RHIMU
MCTNTLAMLSMLSKDPLYSLLC